MIENVRQPLIGETDRHPVMIVENLHPIELYRHMPFGELLLARWGSWSSGYGLVVSGLGSSLLRFAGALWAREDDPALRGSIPGKKRPGIRREWCERILRSPEFTEVQENRRIRRWSFVEELGKYLRVVTLEDGETVHNAMPARNFTRKQRRGT